MECVRVPPNIVDQLDKIRVFEEALQCTAITFGGPCLLARCQQVDKMYSTGEIILYLKATGNASSPEVYCLTIEANG